MTEIAGVLNSMAALVIVSLLGYAAARLGFLAGPAREGISGLVFNITLPCTILNAAGQADRSLGGGHVANGLLLGLSFFLIMLAATYAIIALVKPSQEERPLYLFMGIFTNIVFAGFPVIEALYGSNAVFLGSIVFAVFNLLFYSFGVMLITMGDSGISVDMHRVLSAPLVASAAAMALFLLDIHLPAFAAEACELAGSATSPLGMMLVGVAIAESDFAEVLRERRLYLFEFLRFIALPVVLFMPLRALGMDAMLLGILVVLLAMPVGSIAPAVATAYRLDPDLPARGIVVTTVFSFATFPLLALLLTL